MPERDITRIKLPALLFLAAVASAQTVVVHPPEVPGITMIGPQDAPYVEDVDQILGPVRLPSMSGWLPYGVVVSNGTSQTIVAVAVRWVITGDGMPRTYTFPYDAATAPLEKSRDLTEQVTGRRARQLVQTFQRNGEAGFYQEAGGEAQPLIKLYRE